MEYRKFQPTDIIKVVNLLNICFPNTNISQTSFLWKYFDDFLKNKSIAYVAAENDIICSFVSLVPINISYNGNKQDFYLCAVQATHPEYRRKGLVSKLTQLIENELNPKTNYIGFSTHEGVKIDKYSKKINYNIVGQIQTRHVPSFLWKSNIKIKKINYLNVPKRSDKFFKLTKNSEYFNWRYLKNPKCNYEYLLLQSGNVDIGYIVCKKNRFRFDVMELILDDFDPLKILSIMKAFSRYSFLNKKLYFSFSYLPNLIWLNSFPLISFKKNNEIFLTIKSDLPDVLDKEKWLIQAGDVQ